MRIAHIVSSYPPYYGGMGNVVFQTAEELVSRGHVVEVFTPDYYESKEIKSTSEPVEPEHAEPLNQQIAKVRRLAPQLKYGNAARLPQIGRQLDDFDIVHLHYPFFGTANLVRKWKKRNPHKPLVVTYHMDARASDWKGLVFKLYSKFWMPKILGVADVLIGSSYDFIENSEAAKVYMTHSAKWKEIPFGVNTELFVPREKPAELFAEHNLDKNLPTILFLGGMDSAHYFKGVDVLIEALAIVKSRFGEDIQAVFAGDGNRRVEYEQHAKYVGLKNTRFIGYVPDELLPSVYNMADLFVLPSINQAEAFGLVLLEAMASGVPVLGSNLPGVRSVAELGGQLIKAGDSKHIAEMLVGFLEMTPEQLLNWKTHARSVAEQKFSWSGVTDQLELVYNSLVHK